MKRLHVFLAFLMIVCMWYVNAYEMINWGSTPHIIWQILYVYSFAQAIVAAVYVCYTGYLLQKHKQDWDMIEFQRKRNKKF